MKDRMTAAEYQEYISRPVLKMGNRKTVVDGITFDSQLEANRYCELKILKQAGEIWGFGRQPSFIIMDGGTRYRPDFIVCGQDGDIWVEDAKGHETQTFKIKQSQWAAAYPWLPLRVIKG